MNTTVKKIVIKATGSGESFSMGRAVTVGVLMVTFLISMVYVLISGYQ